MIEQNKDDSIMPASLEVELNGKTEILTGNNPEHYIKSLTKIYSDLHYLVQQWDYAYATSRDIRDNIADYADKMPHFDMLIRTRIEILKMNYQIAKANNREFVAETLEQYLKDLLEKTRSDKEIVIKGFEAMKGDNYDGVEWINHEDILFDCQVDIYAIEQALSSITKQNK